MKQLILALFLVVTPVPVKAGVFTFVSKQYRYNCKTVSVYDADTADFFCDLGFNVGIKVRIRLHGIDAPEVRGESREKGLEARDFLRELILDKDVVLITMSDKKGKYGRYVGDVWLNQPGKAININHTLVENGYAVYKDY